MYKDKLYAFHEGFGQNGQLWFTRGKFDDKGNFKWEDDRNTGFGTTGAPALAIFGGKRYCVHLAKGGKPNQLWWACYNGEKWTTPDTPLGNQRAASTPSAKGSKEKLYCAYQGAANGEFWYVIYDGTSWTDGNKTAYATYGAPALAAYNGMLHAFHEGYQTASVGEGASIGTPIVNAINGPRSFKLWYTAAKPEAPSGPLAWEVFYPGVKTLLKRPG